MTTSIPTEVARRKLLVAKQGLAKMLHALRLTSSEHRATTEALRWIFKEKDQDLMWERLANSTTIGQHDLLSALNTIDYWLSQLPPKPRASSPEPHFFDRHRLPKRVELGRARPRS